MIALSLFLTVSWGITPYYVGSDLIYMVAFTPLMIAGDGGVLSLWTTILAATRRRMRLAVPPPGDELAAVGAQVHRRSVLVGAVVAGGVAVGAALVGWAGRSVAGASGGGGGGGASPTPTPQPTGSPTPSPTQTLPPGAVRITATSTVPVGSAFSFTDPATGDPAYLLQPKQGTFMAYSGVCTHEGCIVNWNSGPSDFTCPCHGAVFSDTGEPLRGPVKEPLAPITVVEYAGDVYSV